VNETRSGPLTKALSANSFNVDFSELVEQATEPTADGTFVGGLGSLTAPQQLLLRPYGNGNPGDAFLMRLWGWWVHGDRADVNNLLWVPLVIAEFKCVLGTRTGKDSRLISSADRFASEITLLSGHLGTYGFICNGSASTAFVKAGLHGAQKYQFDFAQSLEAPGALGNCLWALTSDA